MVYSILRDHVQLLCMERGNKRWSFTRRSNCNALTRSFGVLDSWSVNGSGGLREVVVHGGSTVALSLSSTKEISFEWLTKTIISSID